jgi:hypothetical protein
VAEVLHNNQTLVQALLFPAAVVELAIMVLVVRVAVTLVCFCRLHLKQRLY